ncbi:VOC family protein [Aureimonas sp. AU12]|uniref:VOC family protein n=1 Tax=Aureimonas sp. AU12 TaxID=1638161 RepID=UPI000782C44B|nr:VOC family protein [Aureimonas sp. AU12]
MSVVVGPAGSSPRPVDHVVMPVASLDDARRLFEMLGFQVAPDAAHPFGTANACVFFADGSYIELLAVGDRSAYDAAIAAGSVFVRHDRAFRDAFELPVMSGVAFRSDNADADHERLAAAGWSESDVFEFGRSFRLPDGREGRIAFRLAFARQDDPSEPLFFFCQPAGSTRPDRSALAIHPNGATGLAAIVLNGDDRQAKLRMIRGGVDDDTPFLSLGRAEGDASSTGIAGLIIRIPAIDPVINAAARAALPVRRDVGRFAISMGAGRVPFLAFEDA